MERYEAHSAGSDTVQPLTGGVPIVDTDTREIVPESPTATPVRVAETLRLHTVFVAVAAAGLVLRFLTTITWRPALIYPDTIGYLASARPLVLNDQRQSGYSVPLAGLLHLGQPLTLTAVFQHLFVLAAAVLLYAALVRRGARPWLAAIGCAPLLLDSTQIYVEQFVLPDSMGVAFIVIALALLIWPRINMPAAALGAGLLIGAAIVLRVSYGGIAVAAIAFLVLLPARWWMRVLTAVIFAAGTFLPVGGYLLAYHDEHDDWSLSGQSGLMLYGRVSQFVDCSTLDVPDYQRALCPAEPIGQREHPDWYLWNINSPAYHLKKSTIPGDLTVDDVLGQFARSAMRQQLRPFIGSIKDGVIDAFAMPTANDYVSRDRWLFPSNTPNFGVDGAAEIQEYNETKQGFNSSLAGALHDLGKVLTTPGPLLAIAAVLGLVAGLGVGNARRSGQQLSCLLLTIAPLGLLLATAIGAFPSLRYQMPLVALLPAAGVLAIHALTSPTRAD